MVSILDRDLRLCWMEDLSNFVRGRSEGLLDRARWISGGQRSCQEQLRTPGDHPLLNLRFLAGRSAVLLPSGTSSDPLGTYRSQRSSARTYSNSCLVSLPRPRHGARLPLAGTCDRQVQLFRLKDLLGRSCRCPCSVLYEFCHWLVDLRMAQFLRSSLLHLMVRSRSACSRSSISCPLWRISTLLRAERRRRRSTGGCRRSSCFPNLCEGPSLPLATDLGFGMAGTPLLVGDRPSKRGLQVKAGSRRCRWRAKRPRAIDTGQGEPTHSLRSSGGRRGS